MNYTVTKEDLKGDIEDFPIEVAQWMVNEQFRQKGKADASVFWKDRCDGLEWDITSRGYDFCENVILDKNFDLFDQHFKELKPTLELDYKNLERLLRYAKESKKYGAKDEIDQLNLLQGAIDRYTKELQKQL